ncbi:HEAT repeat protein [Histomonas meleagridis]|uniref:HEAT repeat protein n=1 Tax=Histomonas meleagridis TaxID=135588 RepID=UPI003559FD3D|nr:HEAT repeat protein [Histomonas meleagridis]KAH0798842.1 HEAT repeat protein [Histomonas meleagridis]
MESSIQTFPKSIQKIIRHFQTNTNIPPSKLLSLDYWKTDKFVQYLTYLRELALQDPYDRDSFFKTLIDNIRSFSKETQTYTILPQLISALSFSPTPSLLGPILTIGRLLDEAHFGVIVVPPLVSLFENQDRTLRIHLLNQIDSLVPFLDKNVVNEQIFINIIGGLNDSVPQLRQSTIISMVPLAQFLSMQNMNILIKSLKKLQIDSDPQIRTNSIICIAKIAEFIDPEIRSQTLSSVFSKGTIDPFVPSRKASIAAYKKCKSYFSNIIIATSIIPHLSPLCVDADSGIRISAISTLQMFVDILKKDNSLFEENKQVEENDKKVENINNSKDENELFISENSVEEEIETVKSQPKIENNKISYVDKKKVNSYRKENSSDAVPQLSDNLYEEKNVKKKEKVNNVSNVIGGWDSEIDWSEEDGWGDD